LFRFLVSSAKGEIKHKTFISLSKHCEKGKEIETK
jgi:hypothetical protein